MSIQRKMEKAFSDNSETLILLTGANGYVGGHLLKALEAEGHRIRCAVRRPEAMPATAAGTTIVRADVLDRESIGAAMRGVDTAYYLVHSMSSERSFESADREGARNFAAAACATGVRRIIYLGGLGNRNAALSPHLRSRHEVGELLRASGIQVIEFRASAIIGAGSLSFEMVRALAERLPIMITPRWVTIEAQPIAIEDVIRYLVTALALDAANNRIFEIGAVGNPLGTLRTFPIRPAGIRKAIADALRAEDLEFSSTRWSVARLATPPHSPWGGVRIGNRLIVSQMIDVEAAPATAFGPIRRIGGSVGWYYGRWLWELRALADRLLGGSGMRRGRSNEETIELGDQIDFWRVSALESDRKLTLAAEIRLPGRAWLDFEVEPTGTGSTIRQTAIFDPAGLFGLLYWYLSFSLHQLVFAGMLRNIATASIRPERSLPAFSVLKAPY